MMISDLPWELESEILSRVPAIFLKQFRFTCKKWHALFKDPRFIKKQRNLGKAATQMVLKKDRSVYSFSFDLHGVHNKYEQFIKITGKLQSLKDSQDVKISEIFHCEGLLLCTTKEKRLVVWNPCTGQTRWIQSRLSGTKYFLGYENSHKKSCDSYKILSFSYYRNIQNVAVSKFEIYEFNSDSWRVLDVVGLFPWNVGVSLKGNTYWLDSDDIEDPLVNFILRFDFTTERFGRLPLPFESDGDPDLVAVLSVVREEKLAVLHQLMFDTDDDLKMKIWVANTMTDEAKDLSWSEFLVVDFHKLALNGMTRVMSFLVDEENKKVMCCDKDLGDEDRTRIYIVGEDIYKQVYREMTERSCYISPLLVSYVPSLVQIPARQSSPGGKRKRQSSPGGQRKR